MKKHTNTRKLVTLGLFAAISVILVLIIHVPVFPVVPFLEYDPADVPILIATLMYGPCAGLIVTVVVSVLQGLTVSVGSGVIGIIKHILATGSYVIFGGIIYKKVQTKKGLTVAIAFGALTSTLFMILWNMWFTPLFMHAPTEVVMGMMIPFIIPFNLIKTFGNGIIAALIFAVLKKQKYE